MRMHASANAWTSGTIAATYDPVSDVVRIKAEGLWTAEQVNKPFEDLASIRQHEWRGGPLRVLVDRRDTVVQTAETAHRLHEMTESFYRPGDRVAVVVDNSLAKMQLRRVLDGASHNLFISEAAAMLWLKAGEFVQG